MLLSGIASAEYLPPAGPGFDALASTQVPASRALPASCRRTSSKKARLTHGTLVTVETLLCRAAKDDPDFLPGDRVDVVLVRAGASAEVLLRFDPTAVVGAILPRVERLRLGGGSQVLITSDTVGQGGGSREFWCVLDDAAGQVACLEGPAQPLDARLLRKGEAPSCIGWHIVSRGVFALVVEKALGDPDRPGECWKGGSAVRVSLRPDGASLRVRSTWRVPPRE